MNVSPAMQAALDRIEGVHNARALRYLIRARTERRKLVNSFMAPEGIERNGGDPLDYAPAGQRGQG